MTTVLLWGDRWWLPHHRLPVPFGHPGEAAAMLASAWHDRDRTIRLIYQPDDFATVPATCPNGNRATLAQALAPEHPALAHPGHVWSHEPIISANGEFQTLLHYETRPGLFSLVQQLQERGFTVNSVWPMATWLNALPPDVSESGAMTICAIEANRFCLYRHSGNGVRAVRTGRNGDVLTAIAAHLGGLAAQNQVEYVLYITTDETLVERLNERVPVTDEQVVGLFLVWEALAKQAVINPRHPAQLLPPVPRVTVPQLVTFAAIACFVASVGLGALQIHNWVATQADRAQNQAQKQRLSQELIPLRRNAAEITRWTALRAALAPDPLGWVTLLRALPQGLPPRVVLTQLKADRRGFALEGGVTGPLAAAEWKGWRDRLSGPAAAWTLASAEAVPPTADFTLLGHWR